MFGNNLLLAMSLHDLKTLVLSHHPLIVMDTVEEERATKMVEDACDELGCRCLNGRSREVCADRITPIRSTVAVPYHWLR